MSIMTCDNSARAEQPVDPVADDHATRHVALSVKLGTVSSFTSSSAPSHSALSRNDEVVEYDSQYTTYTAHRVGVHAT